MGNLLSSPLAAVEVSHAFSVVRWLKHNPKSQAGSPHVSLEGNKDRKGIQRGTKSALGQPVLFETSQPQCRRCFGDVAVVLCCDHVWCLLCPASISSALTFTIPQTHPCSMAHGGTSPSSLPLPGWAGHTVCPENHHPLLPKMMGPPLVGQRLKVGSVIYSPCCSSVREVQ